MSLPTDENLLACYPAVLERLKSVPGIKQVKEVGELSELLNAAAHGRKVAPQDSTVYLVFDGTNPSRTAGNKRLQEEVIGFTFVLAQSYRVQGKSRTEEAGRILTAIIRHFIGWQPRTDGAYLTATPFTRRDAPPIEYNDGFALFSISFTTTVIVTANTGD